MAAISTTIVTDVPTPLPVTLRRKRTLATVFGGAAGSGVVTTYYYRQTNGTRGSTTTTGGIPVGAVVERVETA